MEKRDALPKNPLQPSLNLPKFLWRSLPLLVEVIKGLSILILLITVESSFTRDDVFLMPPNIVATLW